MLKFVSLAAVSMLGIAILPILYVMFGAVAGWLVGLLFSKTILGILAAIGISGFSMWQFGAFLGFVGGFFKTISHNK